MNNQIIILSVAGVAVLNLVTMAAGVFVFWKKGGNQASTETIDTYKSAVEAYELRLKQTSDDNIALQKELVIVKETNRIEIIGLHADIDKLRILMQEQERKYQAILVEKDKQITSITAILQNRNPESDVVTQAAKDFMLEKGKKIDEMYKKIVTT